MVEITALYSYICMTLWLFYWSKNMTKQEVVAGILECTKMLGYVPSRVELTKRGGVSRQQIRTHFSTYERALRACNLERKGQRKRVDMESLFRDWAGIVRTLKKIPTGYEYLDLSKYSERPLRTRFGSWALVPQGLKRYAEGKGLAEEWKDVLELVSTSDRHPSGDPQERALPLAAMILADRPMYGALIRPFPLVCEPINEIGVVFLFGAMAERLGFLVLRIQTEFPDCEALRVVGENRLQLVKIEFEHMSRNFFRHMHEPNDCDLIVCWEHNWPECPLPVLELKKELGKLLAACGGNKALPVMNTDSDRVIGGSGNRETENLTAD
jgi:hypothetical protein